MARGKKKKEIQPWAYPLRPVRMGWGVVGGWWGLITYVQYKQQSVTVGGVNVKTCVYRNPNLHQKYANVYHILCHV